MQFDVSLSKFFVLVAGMLLVMAGMTSADSALDAGQSRGRFEVLFVVGWLVIAVAVSLKSVWPVQFDIKRALTAGIGALLILAAAVYAQRALQSSRAAYMGAQLIFMAAWALFVLGVSWDPDQRRFNSKRLALTGAGAVAVVSGLTVLNYNRHYNFKTQRTDGPGRVYNVGLPLFAMGWLTVIFGASQK